MSASESTQPDKPVSVLARLGQWSKSLTSRAKYLILLVSLETLTWTPAFYGEGEQLRGSLSWDDLLVVLTLLSGVLAVSRRKVVTWVGLWLTVLALGTTWAAEFVCSKPLYMASDVCLGGFFLFVAVMILHDIWTTRMVTSDTLVGSVCVYMLIGAAWAFAYSLTELLVPGSFSIASTGETINGKLIEHCGNYPLLMYYSFVTLCSLGYGDLVPIKAAARMVATTEAIVGQFYMAVFVARMISLHLARAGRTERAEGE